LCIANVILDAVTNAGYNVMNQYPHISFQKEWDLSSKSYYYLGQIQAIIKSISYTPIMPNYREQLLRISLQKGAQATTAIEGNTLSDEEISKVYKGESLPPSKEYQAIEVRNIINAFGTILNETVENEKSDLITPDLIRNFHRLVGENLGDHFHAIPGQFRNNNVFVGPYRPPDYQYVPELISKLCDFLKIEFHYTKGQKFIDAVIQAIVAHVYIEWIHPFGDGNGRTGRLIEFYLLMRAGNPDIASHILSNHYNDTRTEYYRQLELAGRNHNLSQFIEYALQGFRDGLNSTLSIIQQNLFNIAWRALVYDKFSEVKYRDNETFKRKRRILLDLPIDKELTLDEIFFGNSNNAKKYGALSIRSLKRELDDFVKMELLIEVGDNYKANVDLLKQETSRMKKTNMALE
jgi:Fic family protein